MPIKYLHGVIRIEMMSYMSPRFNNYFSKFQTLVGNNMRNFIIADVLLPNHSLKTFNFHSIGTTFAVP
jgi:hypothetical protein